MKIRKAKKEDFKEYHEIRKEDWDEYLKQQGSKRKITSNQIRKEFNKFVTTKNHLMLLCKKDKEVTGYLIGTFIKNPYDKLGYVDNLYVRKEFRRRGVAGKLLKEFIRIMKTKGVDKIQLGAGKENRGALKLYKKLGFEIKFYEMQKQI
ncbi:GNAT family N-acetyltransferase [Candidatus Woesearchaeota archaeon]|nr:GNAT family N-acetyltransferase [Candidatus Woesearchaeota archaeon]